MLQLPLPHIPRLQLHLPGARRLQIELTRAGRVGPDRLVAPRSHLTVALGLQRRLGIHHTTRFRPHDDATVGLDDLRLGGPNALGHAKRLVYEVPAMERKEAFAWTADLSARLFRGEEAAAGMKAFLKREKPPWAGE